VLRARRPLRVRALLALTLLAGCAGPRPVETAAPVPIAPRPAGVAAALDAALSPADALRPAYAARGYRPLFVTDTAVGPEAAALIARLRDAGEDNLDPAAYDIPQLEAAVAQARTGMTPALARAELALARAYTALLSDLHRPKAAVGMVYVHDGLAPAERGPAQWLADVARAPSLSQHIETATRLNPLYQELRSALAAHRARGGPDALERAIRLNLERARALPADPGPRFILVDAAGATLRLYEDGRVVDTMRVIVGKPAEPTPLMAARMSYVVMNPYWNLPPDLARERARRVLRSGLSVFRAEHLEMLSGWEEDARVVNPAEVDWKAAARDPDLRMRQLPGSWNMMGDVKFMMPNRMGIYLHDTPNKAPFKTASRRLSSGCVRVEDAPRLLRWVFGPTPAPAVKSAGRDEEVALPAAIPVYITYLTVEARPGGRLAQRPDPDRRDPALLAALSAAPTGGSALGGR